MGDHSELRQLAREGKLVLSNHWLFERHGLPGRQFNFEEIRAAIAFGSILEEVPGKFRAAYKFDKFRWITVIFLLAEVDLIFVKTAFSSGRGDMLWFKRFRRQGRR